MVSLSGRGGRRDGPLLQAQGQEVGPGQQTLSEEAARVNNPQPPPPRTHTHTLVHIDCFFLKVFFFSPLHAHMFTYVADPYVRKAQTRWARNTLYLFDGKCLVTQAGGVGVQG